MDLTFNEQELAFQGELRDWLDRYDPGPEPAEEKAHFAWRREFQRALAGDGLAAVHWPVEYGGRR
jgi:alkylation response protein AidB-like acyl-CoA dehydrogenase